MAKNLRNVTVWLSFWLCAVLFINPTAVRGEADSSRIECWDIFEVSLKGPSSGNPFVDVNLNARFTQGDKVFTSEGFYDGNGTYRIRFMPDKPGEWTYRTNSNVGELDGVEGKFVCVEAESSNHGPVRVHDTFRLAYADGTPYFSVGTTCYAWVHQGDKMEEQTLATLKTAPFNKMRMCVFPKAYAYNKNEPEYYAYEGKPLKDWDFKRFNPAFWHHFEKRVRQLRDMGIEADIIIFHPYDRWGFENMGHENNLFYLRYLVARLAAFRNVWWSFANEYDFLKWPTEHWDEYFQFVRDKDPYNHLRGIHNGRDWYDHTKEWVTHASLQTSNMAAGIQYRQQYQKPVIYDECKYEGDIPQGFGNLTARQMMQRFWLGAMGGCYVGHGETYKHPQDLLWWAKGGVLRGQSPPRIAFFKEFMMAGAGPPFEELQPLGDDKGRYILGIPGEYYLVCFDVPKTITVDLAGNRPYKIDVIDTWEMKETALGTASPGKYTFSASRADMLYRFTPYNPGEKMRPEARVSADVTQGTAPLKVKFRAGEDYKQQWDFGDGTTSAETNPSHMYKQFGQYIVTLTVTDKNGGSAATALLISVLPDENPKNLEQFKTWPGSQSGLVFLWANAMAENRIVDAAGNKVRDCKIEARGDVKISSAGEMQIGTGAFLAKGIDDELLAACKASNQLSIEAVITVSNLEQGGPARIVTFSKDHSNRNFTLGQEGGNLILRLRTPQTDLNGTNPQISLCEIKKGKPMHVIVSYFPGNVYCYIDGKLVQKATQVNGDFSNWEECHLLFGDEWSGQRSWTGNLEGIALYNRFIGPKETALKYALYKK